MGTKKRVPKEFLGAFKHGHRRGVREYIDEDFSFELLKKAEQGDKQALRALKWITKYNNETYRGVLKKGDKSAIHKTKRLYKEASDGHNARRRDLLSNLKSGKLGPPLSNILSIDENPVIFESFISKCENPEGFEDIIISLISVKPSK